MQTLFGFHSILARLENDEAPLSVIYITDKPNDRHRDIMRVAKTQRVPLQIKPKPALDALTKGANHQGIVALAAGARPQVDLKHMLKNLTHNSLFLILDGITDPHNLGAILRSADAAGVAAVILPKDKSAPLNATVSKVACGAAETMSVIIVPNLARAMDTIKQAGVWCVGTAEEADMPVYDYQFDRATAIVMGNEGEGLRRLTREACDALVSLPMRGQIGSLNVSVATGIVLFEVRRQQS